MAKSNDTMKQMLEVLSNPEMAVKFAEFLNSMEKPKKKGRPKKTEEVKTEEFDVIDLTENEPRQEEVNNDVTVIDLTKNSGNKSKNKMCRRVAIGKPVNKFVDDQTEAILDYEQFDKLIKRPPRRKSNRKPVKLKIRCRECKEIKIVDADIAGIRWDTEDRCNYVCDDCIPSRG